MSPDSDKTASDKLGTIHRMNMKVSISWLVGALQAAVLGRQAQLQDRSHQTDTSLLNQKSIGLMPTLL